MSEHAMTELAKSEHAKSENTMSEHAMHEPVDIVVTGSGPAGMIAALAAHHAGLSSVLIGPAVNYGDKRTTALFAPSLDQLATYGLEEVLADIGTPMVTMRLIDGSRRLIRTPTISFDAEEIGRGLFGFNLENAKLNAVLEKAVLACDDIRRVVGLSADYALSDSGVMVTLADGQVLNARTVIAADGRGSPARQAAGLTIKRWDYKQVAAVGIVRHSKLHENVSTELHTETGPYTFVPMEDEDGEHRSSFVCALSPEDADRLSAMDLAQASRFLEARSQQLMGSLKLEAPVQLWPLESLVANAFAAKGVFLIGETAHAFPPIGAQGLNLSIRDAHDAVVTIADAIHSGESVASMRIASRYTAKRRSDVWARTYGVDMLNRSLLSRSPLMHIGRAVAMGATRVSPSLKKGLMMAGLEPFSLRSVMGGVVELMKPGLLKPGLSKPGFPRRSVS